MAGMVPARRGPGPRDTAEDPEMKTMLTTTLLLATLALAACGQSTGDRAVSGGLIGAGTGAAISGLTGKSRAKGYAMGKVKVGKPDINEDIERLTKIREAVGTYPIAIDVNQGWDFGQALTACRKFEKFDLLWVEEPLPSDDISGHARLRKLINIPIGLGENVYNVSQFNEYFMSGGIDFVQADVGRVGGITGYLNIAAVAHTYNLPMTPHFVLELSASLLSTVPNARFAEVTDGGSFEKLGILKSAGTEKDGYYYPSDAPGTGMVYNTEYLAAHRIG
jgi:L-alanine-DL-glutamate epimerase-like enolase superfamily enzyme